MLPAVLVALRCPVCAEPLAEAPASLRCNAGHSFDLARQGYAALAVGRSPGTADTPAMVAARETFLAAGHFAPIAAALAAAAARHVPAVPGRLSAERATGRAICTQSGLVVDVGGGTGYYPARILDALPDRTGLCLDLSAAALKRAARAHPRLAAASADAWQRLPLADGCADVVTVVFAPRNAGELARVLAPAGVLLLVSPDPDHLAELRAPLGLLDVDPAKRDREAAAFVGFHPVETTELRYDMTLDRAAVAAVVGMGPSANHPTGDLAALPDPMTVTAAVRVTALRPGG